MIELKIKTIDYSRIITAHLLMLRILGQSGLSAGHVLMSVVGNINIFAIGKN